MRIVCGFCDATAETGAPCPVCHHDPLTPYTQRGQEPVAVESEAGRPALDVADTRHKIAQATAELKHMGRAVTVAHLADHLGVSDRTVRRWLQVSG
jgi:hypothetical protein